MSEINKISEYYKSFSGTDTLAFILMPGCTPVVIGSLTTISYSMFRNKKPVINIGRTNINGVTRGSRIYAGTMIFTLINQHWLKELQSQIDYIKNFDELKVDELPLFDVMIVSANEYGSAVTMYIYGIDFTDEAQTISVEDLFTENTFSFVARDISTFKSINIHSVGGIGESSDGTDGSTTLGTPVAISATRFVQGAYVLKDSPITFEELGQIEQDIYYSKLKDMNKPQEYVLPRDLYLCNSNLMMGNDVSAIQTLLRPLFPEINVDGVFDSEMDNYVRKYQSMINVNIDGVVDSKLYNSLLNLNSASNGVRLGIVINKNGTFGYRFMSLDSDIHYTLAYKEQVEILALNTDDMNGYTQKWYLTEKGYIIAEDIYSAYDENSIVEFPTIKHGDSSVYTNMVSSLLSTLFPDVKFSNTMDDLMVQKIKELQQENGLVETGEINNETWLLLQTLTGNVKQEMSQESLQISFTRPPGKYWVNLNNMFKELDTFSIKVVSDVNVSIKATAIAYYPNGKTDMKSKTINVKKDTKISLAEFQPMFIYSTLHGAFPDRVEWILYPFNQQPYKWTFYFKYRE